MIVVLREGVAHQVLDDDASWPSEPFIRYDGEVRVGWLYDGSRFVEPGSIVAKALEINATTAETIGAGFAFRDRRFSLSLASQITISNAYTIRASLPYPLRWADADDTGFVVMESASDIEAFYQAATLAVLTARSAGNAAKAAVIEPPPKTTTTKTVTK